MDGNTIDPGLAVPRLGLVPDGAPESPPPAPESGIPAPRHDFAIVEPWWASDHLPSLKLREEYLVLLRGNVERALILETIARDLGRVSEDKIAQASGLASTFETNPDAFRKHLRALVRRKYIRAAFVIPVHYHARRDVLSRALEGLGYAMPEYPDPYYARYSGAGFTLSDISELKRLRVVARYWSEGMARTLFADTRINLEDYESLRRDLEGGYLDSNGDENRAEDRAWNRVFNEEMENDEELWERMKARENQRAAERGDDLPWEV